MRHTFSFYLQHENIANHFRELLDCQQRIKSVKQAHQIYVSIWTLLSSAVS